MIFYCEARPDFVSIEAMAILIRRSKFIVNLYDHTIIYPLVDGEADCNRPYNLISHTELQDVIARMEIGA